MEMFHSNNYPIIIDRRFELGNRFSKRRHVDCVLRHHLLKLFPVVDHVISRDVEMRQFVKGRMIVQVVWDKRSFRVGVVATESQHS